MATTTENIKNLIINKIESQVVFDYMVSNGLVNEDELYLVQGESGAVLYTAQELTEEQKRQARENIGAVSDTDVQIIVNGLGALASKDTVSLTDLAQDVQNEISDAHSLAAQAKDAVDTHSSSSTAHSDIRTLLDEKFNHSDVIPVANGGTGRATIADTEYSVAKYRASALVNSETNPTENGTICWTYE